MKDLTPQQIVRELDRYIVGQAEAKRVVAIALRNRYRRLALPEELQAEITPKNILMIGPTGVGKTEIARRLAKMADAPFIKVEATKFTQVGYVGRDAESIVRDLMDVAVGMVHDERVAAVRDKAAKAAEDRIVDILTDKAVAEQPAARATSRSSAPSRGKGNSGSNSNASASISAIIASAPAASAPSAASKRANWFPSAWPVRNWKSRSSRSSLSRRKAIPRSSSSSRAWPPTISATVSRSS